MSWRRSDDLVGVPLVAGVRIGKEDERPGASAAARSAADRKEDRRRLGWHRPRRRRPRPARTSLKASAPSRPRRYPLRILGPAGCVQTRTRGFGSGTWPASAPGAASSRSRRHQRPALGPQAFDPQLVAAVARRCRRSACLPVPVVGEEVCSARGTRFAGEGEDRRRPPGLTIWTVGPVRLGHRGTGSGSGRGGSRGSGWRRGAAGRRGGAWGRRRS